MMKELKFEINVKTKSEANSRGCWQSVAARKKKQRRAEQFAEGESENIAKMMKSPESGRVFSGRTMTNINEANADRVHLGGLISISG